MTMYAIWQQWIFSQKGMHPAAENDSGKNEQYWKQTVKDSIPAAGIRMLYGSLQDGSQD